MKAAFLILLTFVSFAVSSMVDYPEDMNERLSKFRKNVAKSFINYDTIREDFITVQQTLVIVYTEFMDDQERVRSLVFFELNEPSSRVECTHSRQFVGTFLRLVHSKNWVDLVRMAAFDALLYSQIYHRTAIVKMIESKTNHFDALFFYSVEEARFARHLLSMKFCEAAKHRTNADSIASDDSPLAEKPKDSFFIPRRNPCPCAIL